MNELKDRLKAVRLASGLSQTQLGKLAGVSQSAIAALESGRNKSATFIPLIASVLNVNALWLSDGVGEMRPGDGKPSSLVTITPTAQDYILIPMMDAAPKMGIGGILPDYDMVIDGLRLSKGWVRQNLPTITSPKNLSVLSAFGDSMSPTLNDGDILLIDCGVNELKLDAVYVLALNDELYVKRVQRRITDGAVTIKSDNTMYDPVTVTNHEKDSLRVLGRVVWAWNARKL